jgi:predicted esterase
LACRQASALRGAEPVPKTLKSSCYALCAAVLWACGAGTSSAPSRTEPVAGLRRVEIATLPIERSALAELPTLSPDRVELAVAFPNAFDPTQEHPILITQVTADRFRSNIDELPMYAPAALADGYVVLTAQGIPWPQGEGSDNLMHRYVSVRAALRWLAGEIPQSERWPIVIAGFSGGAKISQVLAVSLMLEQRRVAGVFLGGCNEDHSGLLLGQYPAVKDRFSHIAFFLSAGRQDRIATLEAVHSVADGLRRSGVEQLELSVHPGGHQLDKQDLSKALHWFQAQLGVRAVPAAPAQQRASHGGAG